MPASVESEKQNTKHSKVHGWQQFYEQILGLLVISPLLLASCILFLLLAIGTLGYVLIEGWSVSDSLFMIVITLSTIGYGEVRPLSEGGRLFTIALIIVGVVGLKLNSNRQDASIEHQEKIEEAAEDDIGSASIDDLEPAVDEHVAHCVS